MAQGVEYTQQERDEVIETLKPFFQRGCSINRACDYGGFPRTTLQTWVENDDVLRLKITAWQSTISVQARENIAKAVLAGDKEYSMKWLEKKEKDEFSNRTELGGLDNTPLFSNKDKEAVLKFEEEWFEHEPKVLANEITTTEPLADDKLPEAINNEQAHVEVV